MKAVGLTRYLPVDDPEALQDLQLSEPGPPQGRDLLVRVQAISVNPVDTKLRARARAGKSRPASSVSTPPAWWTRSGRK